MKALKMLAQLLYNGGHPLGCVLAFDPTGKQTLEARSNLDAVLVERPEKCDRRNLGPLELGCQTVGSRDVNLVAEDLRFHIQPVDWILDAVSLLQIKIRFLVRHQAQRGQHLPAVESGPLGRLTFVLPRVHPQEQRLPPRLQRRH